MTIAWVKIKDHLNQMKFQSLFLIFFALLGYRGNGEETGLLRNDRKEEQEIEGGNKIYNILKEREQNRNDIMKEKGKNRKNISLE